MSRGGASPVGATRISANGYHYTRTEKKWRLTHHIIMEAKLGRKLNPGERVIFVDGKRTNLNSDNIEISIAARGSLRRRKAVLEAKLFEINDELREINAELAKV